MRISFRVRLGTGYYENILAYNGGIQPHSGALIFFDEHERIIRAYPSGQWLELSAEYPKSEVSANPDVH